ncbi:hypothetical protein DL96DRAFT_235767 [Flagelloscypha sp. PMI_526]|nr:hypothetical protein DL96DRAFT_235767 [Flagelloscypha sp. PMI_526]
MTAQDGLQLETPEDFLLLLSDIAFNASVSLLSGALCYGVFLVLTLIALHLLGQRPIPRSRPTKILHWTIHFLLVTFTVSVSLQAGGYMLKLRWPRLGSPDTPLKERYHTGLDIYQKFLKGMLMLHPIPYMIADAVPIWRAYVLWSHSRKVRVLLIAVCVVNMAVCLTRSVLEYLGEITQFLYPAQLAFSTITNTVVTIAIGIRAWHHRALAKDLRRTSSQPINILLALVEAGALLCFTQVVNLTLVICGFLLGSRITSPFLLAAVVFSIFGDTVAAAYPALIVIILSFRGSTLEQTSDLPLGMLTHAEGIASKMGERAGGGEGRLTTIQFATSAPSSESTIDLDSSGLYLDRRRKADNC